MAFYIKEFNMYGSQIQGHKSFRANYQAFDDMLYRPEEVASLMRLAAHVRMNTNVHADI